MPALAASRHSSSQLHSHARPGFSETFFEANGIDAIHVITPNNGGCKYPEIDEACRRVRELTAPYPHVVTSTRAIGGYGAIRLSGRVGAHVALAISRNSPINSVIAPFEPRWFGNAGRIDFGIERSASHAFIAKTYVALARTGQPRLFRLAEAKHCQFLHSHHEACSSIKAQLETLGRLRQCVRNPN